MGDLDPLEFNEKEDFSPVTLNRTWPSLGRLLGLLICSTIGTFVNGFFVSAFFVECVLNHIGNVFLACIGLADLMLTMGIMPVSALAVVEDQWDTVGVCKALQFIALASTYSYSMFFAFVAINSYYKFCKTDSEYESFATRWICFIAPMIFTISFTLAGMGVYLGLDYDYCTRNDHGNKHFRIITAIVFHVIPFFVTSYCLICAKFLIKYEADMDYRYRRSLQYRVDCSNLNLNIIAYVLYIVAWIPYLIISYDNHQTSDRKYYYTVWLGMSRSLVTSIFYSTLSESFRRAFSNVFCYCCCKVELPGPHPTRQGRALNNRNNRNNAPDIRVHILHQAITTSPHRSADTVQETQNL